MQATTGPCPEPLKYHLLLNNTIPAPDFYSSSKFITIQRKFHSSQTGFMKTLFLICLLLNSGSTAHDSIPEFIDPTGTYILKGKVVKHEIVGHSGEIRVKLLNARSIAMCFYINSGYPDYISGSFIDTLPYRDNQVRYQPAHSGCIIQFCFDHKMAEIQQLLTDPRSGCGFSPGVMISAFFRKSSSERPVIQDLSKHGD